MNGNEPVVSIGMPVFNAGKYIREAVDSFLAQTYTDFELIISDNASTDDTEKICREYAEKDKRVRYCRNSLNLGASANFNKVFELSRGRYFKWAAHDDIIAPDFLAKCVHVLDKDKKIVLSFSKVTVIDENTKPIDSFELDPEKISSSDPCVRFGNIINNDRGCYDVFGLIRSDEFKKTPLLAPYVASDRTLRAELSLRGAFCQLPEYLFLSRDHMDRSVRALPAHHLRGEWFDPKNKGKVIFPHWRMFLEYFKCLHRVKLKLTQKLRCSLSILRWLVTDLNCLRMAADVVIAVNPRVWNFIEKKETKNKFQA